MFEFSAQQEERLNALMMAGGFGSGQELLNAMLADFEYQQQLRQLRKEIQKGMQDETIDVDDPHAFLSEIFEEAQQETGIYA